MILGARVSHPPIDLILHPIRLRIITTLAGQRYTAQTIGELLPDVAQATLYRHLKALTEGGVLDIVESTPIRGAVEKVYALADESTLNLDPAAIRDLGADDHMRYFAVFAATLLADFAQYLAATPDIDFVRDGVGYHTHAVYLSDEELTALAKGINGLLAPYFENGPGAGRRRRLFSTILRPSPDATEQTHGRDNDV